MIADGGNVVPAADADEGCSVELDEAARAHELGVTDDSRRQHEHAQDDIALLAQALGDGRIDRDEMGQAGDPLRPRRVRADGFQKLLVRRGDQREILRAGLKHGGDEIVAAAGAEACDGDEHAGIHHRGENAAGLLLGRRGLSRPCRPVPVLRYPPPRPLAEPSRRGASDAGALPVNRCDFAGLDVGDAED